MRRGIITELQKWQQNRRRKPLLLRGARQVGKSWLLKEFGKDFRKCHYLNLEKDLDTYRIFDNLDPKIVLHKLSLHFKQEINYQKDLLIIDEIQEYGRALTSLKYFCEDLPEMAVCAAGSHVGVTFADQSFPVGKVEIKYLHPVSFKEYLQYASPELIQSYESFEISEFEHELLWQEYHKYTFTGGMPEAVSLYNKKLSSIREVRSVQQQLLHSYKADFSKHAGKQNASHILATYENIPKQLETSYDDTVARFKFKGILPNRSKYSQFKGPIDWLEHTGLVLKCHNVNSSSVPLTAYEKDNLFKLFYGDIGLLNAALNLEYTSIMAQNFGSYKGFIAENFVAQELRVSGENLHYWKKNDSSSAAEIEFLLEHLAKAVPVEVKSGAKSLKAKSLKAYKEKYAPKVAVKLSGKNLTFETDQINAPIYLAGRLKELITYVTDQL